MTDVAVDAHPVLRRTSLRDSCIPGHGFGVHGFVYDANEFARIHPGGSAWIRSVCGTDATILFEMSHINAARAARALSQLSTIGTYELKCDVDFEPYRRLKERVFSQFPTRASRRSTSLPFWVACAVCALMHCLVLSTGASTSYGVWLIVATMSAVSNTVIGAHGHNYLHQLDPKALALDWNGLSCFEWLLEHVVSHHPHPNTKDDHDSLSMLPLVDWTRRRWKNLAIFPVFMLGETAVALQGNFGHRCRWASWRYDMPAWMNAGPFLLWLRVFTYFVFQGPFTGLATLSLCMTIASFYFSLAAHLNHTRDAQTHKEVISHQLGATCDISVPYKSLNSLLLGLDRQTAHHLFPTIDHALLDKKLYDKLWVETSRHELVQARPHTLLHSMLTRVVPICV